MTKLTGKQIGELSSKKLTQSIALLLYKNVREINGLTRQKIQVINNIESDIKCEVWRTVDYCHDWNDLYPLILQFKIERHLQADGSHLFDAYLDDKDCFTVIKENDEQVQRGYCECLLLTLQETVGMSKQNIHLISTIG